jgi:twitching motility protein PilT
MTRRSGMLRAAGFWIGPQDTQNIHSVLNTAREGRATDVHVIAGSPIFFRIDGALIPYGEEALTRSMARHLSYAMLSESQIKEFEENLDIDFMTTDDELQRYRVNVSFAGGAIGAVIRVLPNTPMALEDLHLPAVVETMANANKGLLLITGSTSQGKTTTMAAIVDYINRHHGKHIITIEDPIEYLHVNQRSIVRQREVGRDTNSFRTGLRAALRQDPDVILIGEMRDFETIEIAVRAAETGVLVLSTLHIISTDKVMDRLLSYGTPGTHGLLRVMVAEALLGIVHQELLPTVDGGKRVACETLVATPAVRGVLRAQSDHQLKNVIQSGRKAGMQTMEQSLSELLEAELISEATYEDVLKSYV